MRVDFGRKLAQQPRGEPRGAVDEFTALSAARRIAARALVGPSILSMLADREDKPRFEARMRANPQCASAAGHR